MVKKSEKHAIGSETKRLKKSVLDLVKKCSYPQNFLNHTLGTISACPHEPSKIKPIYLLPNLFWMVHMVEILHEADPTDEADPPHLPRLEEQVAQPLIPHVADTTDEADLPHLPRLEEQVAQPYVCSPCCGYHRRG